jgi:hypothetical protein
MKEEKIEEEMQRWNFCNVDYNIEGKLNTEDIERYAMIIYVSKVLSSKIAKFIEIIMYKYVYEVQRLSYRVFKNRIVLQTRIELQTSF